jgi:hypothetical protein
MSVIAVRVPESISSAHPRAPFTERGALRLFVRRDSFFGNLRDCIVAVVSPEPPQSSNRAHYVIRQSGVTRTNYPGRSGSLSLVIHCAVVALLIYLPPLFPVQTPAGRNLWQPSEKIYYYYSIPQDQIAKTPRRISTASSGGRSTESQPPKLSSAPLHSLAAIMSKPAHPDNSRQTIYQSASPPELILRTEQKLPNIVILEPYPQTLKAPLAQSYAHPAQAARQASAPQAPVISAANAPTLEAILQARNSPNLVIPSGGGGSPIKRGSEASEGPPPDAPDVVIVGVDPADAPAELSLLNGNRAGEFAIAPPAQPNGSPNGASNGTGGNNSGDASAGSSGIGKVSAAVGSPGPVDIAGTKDGGSELLAASLPLSLVYPVAQPAIPVRRNAMVISAGPIGGGGLNLYGVLNCGKVYSIFLPMPETNWSLQYCDRSLSRGKMTADPRTAVLSLDSPLVPPDVDLQHRYDFKRTPVPAPMAHRPIILKGVIEADGTVQQLVVYRGVSPVVDEAARIAFSRWRFKPAIRDGKAVAVDILVGIPPASGQDYINR